MKPVGPTAALPPPAGLDEPSWEIHPQGARLKADAKTKFYMGCMCHVSLLAVIALVVLGISWKPIDLQTDFSAFMEADVPAYIIRSGFNSAKKARLSTSEGRRLSDDTLMLYRPFDIELAYGVKGGVTNLLSLQALSLIRNLEQNLRSFPLWIELCEGYIEEIDRSLCLPGISLANYISPRPVFDVNGTDDVVPTGLRYDESVPDPLPLEAAKYLVPSEILQHILRKDATGLPDTITELRTVYRFNFVCCPADTPVPKQKIWAKDMKKKWATMLETQVLPFLQSHAESYPLEVAYDGSEIYETEILQVIDGDLNLAYISMAVVFLYIAAHTRSIFLSIVALVTVVLAVPLSYVCFAVIADTTEMSIASLLALFLVVGLGSDVIFVYMDFWRESKAIDSSASVRLAFTWRNAGKATLATSIATALSFFANLASVLRPLREFGFFMGLCVMFVWCLVPLIFLPSCMFDELWLSCCNLDCQRRLRQDHKEKPYLSCRDRSLKCFVWQLHQFRCFYLFVPAITLIIMLIVAISECETSSKTPQLLPEDHLINKRLNALKVFNGMESTGVHPVQSEITICDPRDFDTFCARGSIAWCMASEIPRNNPRECHCYQKSRGFSCRAQSTMPITHRVIGKDSLTDWELWTLAERVPYGVEFPTGEKLSHTKREGAPSVILHNWLAGRFEFKSATQVSSIVKKELNSSSCGLDNLCFCDDVVCDPADSWFGTGKLFLGEGGQRRLRQSITNTSEQEWPPVVITTPEARQSRLSRTQEREQQQEALALEHVLTRRLQTDLLLTADTTRMVKVQVIHGLILQEGSPLLGKRDSSDAWLFNKHFECSDPWAQRRMMTFCNIGQMQAWGLHVNEASCWISNFKFWIQSYTPRDGEPSLPEDSKLRFPLASDKFDYYLYLFSQNAKMDVLGQAGLQSKAREFMWLRDGKLKAAYMSFLTDVEWSTSGSSASAFKETWDVYLRKFAPRALDGVPSAYHTSSLWVRAEVQGELIQSVIVTLAIVVVLAFLTVFLFTESPSLSLCVVVATIGVLSGLLFIIVCIMNDKIGPIEVIALIVFIGYSVTYSLHIAHHYGEDAAVAKLDSDVTTSVVRLTRVKYAVNAIGGGIGGSAITTFGCSAFLLGCTLNIFQKLGGVAIAVTVMSIILSLLSLPAFLLVAGPRNPGVLRSCKRGRSLCFRSSATFRSDLKPLPLPAVSGNKESPLPVAPPAPRNLQLGIGSRLSEIVEERPQQIVLPDFKFSV